MVVVDLPQLAPFGEVLIDDFHLVGVVYIYICRPVINVPLNFSYVSLMFNVPFNFSSNTISCNLAGFYH